MAKAHGKNARIYVDEYNWSGYANSWTLTLGVDTAEVTTFTDAAKEYLEGMYGHTFGWTGFYDPTGIDEDSFTQVITEAGTTRYVALLPLGATAGYVAYELAGKHTARPITSGVTEAITLAHEHQGTGGAYRGQVAYSGTLSENTDAASIDYGAKAEGATLLVTYRVLAWGGPDDLTLNVEESTHATGDGDAFEAVTGASDATLSAASYSRKLITGTTERYLRVTATSSNWNSKTATVLATITTLNT